MNVLLSIKPRFAEKILSGEKQYEFRKTTFRRSEPGDTVFLYASSPVQCIVGTFEIGRIIQKSPSDLWQAYGDKSGINDQKQFFEYYAGYDSGYAIRVRNPSRLQSEVRPHKHFDEFTPPVSFQYVDEEFRSTIENTISHSILASD